MTSGHPSVDPRTALAFPDGDDPRPPTRTEPAFAPTPVTIQGRVVRLEPLSLDHADGLLAAGLADLSVFRWMADVLVTRADVVAWIERALEGQATGRELPFAQVSATSGEVIGSTRYLSIEPVHRRLEIGYTWLCRSAWGTGANSEAKYLLLDHAFERLGANRVEFKTDALNHRSRAALLAIGATEEGVFRRHQLTQGGRLRDSAWYSVTWDEWPDVREHLRARIDEALARG